MSSCYDYSVMAMQGEEVRPHANVFFVFDLVWLGRQVMTSVFVVPKLEVLDSSSPFLIRARKYYLLVSDLVQIDGNGVYKCQVIWTGCGVTSFQPGETIECTHNQLVRVDATSSCFFVWVPPTTFEPDQNLSSIRDMVYEAGGPEKLYNCPCGKAEPLDRLEQHTRQCSVHRAYECAAPVEFARLWPRANNQLEQGEDELHGEHFSSELNAFPQHEWYNPSQSPKGIVVQSLQDKVEHCQALARELLNLLNDQALASVPSIFVHNGQFISQTRTQFPQGLLIEQVCVSSFDQGQGTGYYRALLCRSETNQASQAATTETREILNGFGTIHQVPMSKYLEDLGQSRFLSLLLALREHDEEDEKELAKLREKRAYV